MSFEQWKRRIKSLGDVMFQGRCQCPIDSPAETNKVSDDVEISEIREIDVGPVPCPKCRGWRHMVYVMKVISTSKATNQITNNS
jgi:hypothetical protein